ncbi:MAG: hypothetical protein M0Q49_04730 [Porticoccaceae bacterium]|nr:hypothetical protein [Porticoccaceae bacterium]
MATRDMIVRLSAQTGAFDAAMKKSSSSVSGFGAKLGGIGKLVGGAFAVGAVVSFGKRIFETADATAKLARDLDATLQQTSALEMATYKAGMETGRLGMMMSRLQQTMARPQGRAGDALKSLGIDQVKMQGKDAYEMLQMIGEKMQSMSNTAKKGVAIDLFGTRGGRMTQVLAGLKDADERMERIYERIGLVGRGAEDIESLNDAFAEMKHTFNLIGTSIANDLAPALEGLAVVSEEAALKGAGWLDNYMRIMAIASRDAHKEGKGMLGAAWEGVKAIPKATFNWGQGAQEVIAEDRAREAKQREKVKKKVDAAKEKKIAKEQEEMRIEAISKEVNPYLAKLETPTERIIGQMELFAEAMQEGLITGEEYYKLMGKAQEDLDKNNESLQEAISLAKEYKDEQAELEKKLETVKAYKDQGLIDEGTYTRAAESIKTALEDLDPALKAAKEEKERHAKYLEDQAAEEQKKQEQWIEDRAKNEEWAQEQLEDLWAEHADRMSEAMDGTASQAGSLSEIIGKQAQTQDTIDERNHEELKRMNDTMREIADRLLYYTPVLG